MIQKENYEAPVVKEITMELEDVVLQGVGSDVTGGDD
jgi:hypothetical protein